MNYRLIRDVTLLLASALALFLIHRANLPPSECTTDSECFELCKRTGGRHCEDLLSEVQP